MMDVKQPGLVNLKNSPGFPILAKVMAALEEKGIKAYLVGGYIRDILLKRNTADIDLALPNLDMGLVRQTAEKLHGKFVLLDELNKVARIALKEKTGRSWNVDFSSLRGTIEEDLRERDFTINSLALELEPALLENADFRIIDPWQGIEHLKEKLIRVVNPGAFQADSVRLLRAIRFAAELGFSIEEKTEGLIKQNAPLLNNVAGERVRFELVLILQVPRAYAWLRYMDRLGLLEVIFPELARSRGVEQPKEHHWDVFEHSLETVKAVERLLTPDEYRSLDELLSEVPWSPEIACHFSMSSGGEATRGALLKLAALLHDIAKPQTRTREGERWRFLGHAKEGAALVEEIMQRLRFSRREVNIVTAEIQHHLRPGQLHQGGLPTHRAIYRYFRDVAEVALDTLFLSLADHLATKGPNLDRKGWEDHVKEVAYILREKEKTEKIVSPVKLIDGHDLINILNMKPGPEMGRILEEVREAQAAGEITTREEALAFVNKSLGTFQGE